jgi:hypothetical protein
MSEPHVISALKDKRAELAGELRSIEQRIVQVRADLATLDRTLCIFDPDAKPHLIRAIVRRGRPAGFRPGGWTRTVIDALRRADKPLSVREIATLVAAETSTDIDTPGTMNRISNKVRNTLARQREGLLAREWQGAVVFWSVAE